MNDFRDLLVSAWLWCKSEVKTRHMQLEKMQSFGERAGLKQKKTKNESISLR